MPNFTVGGIDVLAEPTFEGFHEKAQEELDAEQARLRFEVEASPRLVAGFAKRLQEQVEKSTAGVRFEVEASPVLAKGFKADLREQLDKSTSGVRMDIEARPVLMKGFQKELRAQLDKSSAGVRIDVEVRPVLASGFKSELRAQIKEATANGAGDVRVNPVLSPKFAEELQAQVQAAAAEVRIEVPVEPLLDAPAFREKLFTFLDVATAGVGIDIPVRPFVEDPEAFRLRVKTLVETFSEGVTIDIPIRPVLGPRFAAETAAIVKEAETASRFSIGLKPGSSDKLAKDIISKLGTVVSFGKNVVGGVLSGVERTLTGVLSLTKKAAIGFGLMSIAVLAAGGAGLKSAADLELQRRGLEILLQSVAKGDKLFKGIQQIAVTTPFQVPDLTPIARQLLVIRNTLGDKNFSLARVLPSVQTISDLGAALGSTGAQLQRVGLAFGKIAGRGKLTAEELRSLSKNLPGFSAIQAIADKLGVSVPQAFAAVTKGAVDSKTAIDGILEGMRKFPGAAGAAAKLAQTTFKGALSNFPDILRNSFFDAFQNELPTLTKVIGPDGALVKTLEGILPVVAKAFTPIATGILGSIQKLVPGIDAVVTASLPLILVLIHAIGELGPTLTAVGHGFSAVFGPIAQVVPGLARELNTGLLGPLHKARGDLQVLGVGFAAALSGIIDGIATLAPLLGPVANLLGIVFAQFGFLAPVLAKALFPALQVVIPVLGTLVGILGGMLRAATPLLPVLGKIVAAIGTALGDALKRIDMGALVTALSGLAEAAGQVIIALAPLIPAFVVIATNIATSLTPVIEALAPVVSGLLVVLIPVLESLANLAPLIAMVLLIQRGITGFRSLAKSVATVTTEMGKLKTGTFASLNNLSAGLGDKVFSGMVLAAATAAAGISGYMAGASKNAITSLTSIAAAGVSIFIGFQQGGPVGAAIAAAAAVVGFFFGRAKKQAEEAKAAQAAYKAEVMGLRDAFNAAGIDKFSSTQAKATIVAKKMIDTLKGSGKDTDSLKFALDGLGIRFDTVATAAAKGTAGVHGLNAEIERATSSKAELITEHQVQGVEDFGKTASITNDTLVQLGRSWGTAGASGLTFEQVYLRIRDSGQNFTLKTLADTYRALGANIGSTNHVATEFERLLQHNLANTPAALYIQTLPAKTRAALTQQQQLADVQNLVAAQQERQSSSAKQFSDAYDTVTGSLSTATTAYKDWLLGLQGDKAPLADVNLGVIDLARQIEDLGSDKTLSAFQKQQKGFSLIAQAQGTAGDAIARFIDESGGSFEVFRFKAQAFKDQLVDGLASSLDISTAKAKALVDQIVQIPDEHTFHVKLDSTQAATGLDDLATRIQAYITANIDNQALLNIDDPRAKAVFLQAIIDQYDKSHPSAVAGLNIDDPKNKKQLLDTILAGIDGKTVTATAIIDIQERIAAGQHSLLVGGKAKPMVTNAAGSIVREPILSLIGEDGPELILPLTNIQRMIELLQQLGLDLNTARQIAAQIGGQSVPTGLGAALGASVPGGAGGPVSATGGRSASKLVPTLAGAVAPLGEQLDKATAPGLTTWVKNVDTQTANIGTSFVTMADKATATSAGLPARLQVAAVPGVTAMAAQLDGQTKRVTQSFTTMGASSSAAVASAGSTINATLVAAGVTLAANASTAGTNAVEAMNKALMAGTGKVGATVRSYGATLAGGLNPILSAVGAKQLPTKLARGGRVMGPDVRADIVPALLMPGEFVVRRDAVAKYGESMMHALNRGDLPRFAGGGIVTGDIAGLNPTFLSRLSLWSSAIGESYHVNSGYRSFAEQARLYQRFLAGVPGQAEAAPPGHSMHNYGLAADGNRWRDRNPGAFSMRYPMSFEPWHIEPNEARQWAAGAAPDGSSGGAGLGLSPLAKPPAVGGDGAVAVVARAVMAKAYEAALSWAGNVTLSNPMAGSANLSAFPVNVQRALSTIRSVESGGNYSAHNPTSSAFGAYQFLASTYAALARRFGLDPRNTSPAEQDQIAGDYVLSILQQYGGDIRAIPSVWYTGQYHPGAGDYTPRGNSISVNAYIAKWLQKYAKGYSQGGVVSRSDVVRVAERNRPEAIIPLTKPARARQVMDESGLTAMVRDQLASDGPMFAEGAIVVEVAAPDAAAPEAYGASVANRLAPALAAAIARALGT